MSLRKFIAALTVALSAIAGVGFASTPAAVAGDTCDVCIEVWTPPDCNSPTAHNWKLCGEDPTTVESTLAELTFDGAHFNSLVGEIDPKGADSEPNLEGNDLDDVPDELKHNWKRQLGGK